MQQKSGQPICQNNWKITYHQGRNYKNDKLYILKKHDVCVRTSLCCNSPLQIQKVKGENNFATLNVNGLLRINKGCVWNGMSGWKDADENMYPSLVHDTLYRIMRTNNIGGYKVRYKFRQKADKLFKHLLEKHHHCCTWFIYGVVRIFGGLFTLRPRPYRYYDIFNYSSGGSKNAHANGSKKC